MNKKDRDNYDSIVNQLVAEREEMKKIIQNMTGNQTYILGNI